MTAAAVRGLDQAPRIFEPFQASIPGLLQDEAHALDGNHDSADRDDDCAFLVHHPAHRQDHKRAACHDKAAGQNSVDRQSPNAAAFVHAGTRIGTDEGPKGRHKGFKCVGARGSMRSQNPQRRTVSQPYCQPLFVRWILIEPERANAPPRYVAFRPWPFQQGPKHRAAAKHQVAVSDRHFETG